MCPCPFQKRVGRDRARFAVDEWIGESSLIHTRLSEPSVELSWTSLFIENFKTLRYTFAFIQSKDLSHICILLFPKKTLCLLAGTLGLVKDLEMRKALAKTNTLWEA